MKYGLTLPITGVDGDIHRLVEYAQLAEGVGWDGVFLEDYIVYHAGTEYPVYDPWVALAGIAMRTERVYLGTTVTPLPRRRPWKIARECVTLDHLSRGRFILGIGLGDGHDKSFVHFGEIIDLKQRVEMVDESLDILEGLWSGQPFSYSGKHYHVDEVMFLPKPVQTPRIPIWVGSAWPRKGTIRRAARSDGAAVYKVNEDGTYGELTPEDVRELKRAVEQRRSVTRPFDVVIGGSTPGDDRERARAIVRSFVEVGLTWWMEFVDPSLGGAALRRRIEQGPPRVEMDEKM